LSGATPAPLIFFVAFFFVLLTLGFDISSYLGFRYKPIDKILTVLLSPQFVQFVSSLANPLLNLVWRLNRL
jgi:hypothetical protein